MVVLLLALSLLILLRRRRNLVVLLGRLDLLDVLGLELGFQLSTRNSVLSILFLREHIALLVLLLAKLMGLAVTTDLAVERQLLISIDLLVDRVSALLVLLLTKHAGLAITADLAVEGQFLVDVDLLVVSLLAIRDVTLLDLVGRGGGLVVVAMVDLVVVVVRLLTVELDVVDVALLVFAGG